ncbi:two-component system, NtrC family, nitrogen regulation sensor histidine kinase NtrY [Sphingomonas guangdongensis]|uniref:histidine kinase n=1 Tax=Sphingomonas guangdongensis TaxID=1141890 RepID=A0A285R190_9SPHN|nr:ATP-binding protein [Sphingomonas guangdongensis]SOB87861.1 two-component system, NtrC family, nitrogen regulation sensor histidine kinase NtrY [Sphingomonas guangdongensis]
MTVAAVPMTEGGAPARRRSVTPALEVIVLAVAVVIAIVSWRVISGTSQPTRLLTPPLVALLLTANLIPGIALLVLIGRRIAIRRAQRSPVGGEGRLHVRLVALFSVLASVPTLLVTIFASLLFQYGVEFWSSDRARGMLENANALATQSYRQIIAGVDRETITMASDINEALQQTTLDNPEFARFLFSQVYFRNLSEGLLFSISPRGEVLSIALVNPYDRDLTSEINPQVIGQLTRTTRSVTNTTGDRIWSITRVGSQPNLYLYGARVTDTGEMAAQSRRAEAVLADYRTLVSRSRSLQLQFNAALLAVSLLIVGLAVFVALAVADRLVRPVGELVDAARRVAGGDLSARVPAPRTRDEVGTLATAFNRMTERLGEQTGALVEATAEAESRRVLIEAVLSGVSAGVVAVEADRRVRLLNSSAQALVAPGGRSLTGQPLAEVSPELDQLLLSGARDGIVQIATGGEARTLAVKITRDEGGHVLTFDDITQQLTDQRRAAWSDVARRIAHEIKNPLTPIQLAAERLQRRYGKLVEEGDTTFARLTETIVRQVGDLRRMVDEFSSFARMPKPVFREEQLVDLARQALFLHEVAHPGIRFALFYQDPVPGLVCDRRQLGQALTNLVKNAVEAIEARTGEELSPGEVTIVIEGGEGRTVAVRIADNGVGLPVERDRIVEPYMTTRARGTGLGLAIVKKIIDEHFGTIAFADRDGGGTVVSLTFDAAVLAKLAEPDLSSDPANDPSPAMLTRSRTIS